MDEVEGDPAARAVPKGAARVGEGLRIVELEKPRLDVGKLEGDLKREWAKSMNPPIDKSQLRYVTKKVFADFAGWVQPEPE